MSQYDLNKALELSTNILKRDILQKDADGFCLINELCEKIKEIDSSLSYINNFHIVELYFKEKRRKILISGTDKIKYKDVRYVQPPEILYFGTTDTLANKMRQYGIRSITKGYIKIYDTPEKAALFAKKFAGDKNKIIIFIIKALEAFSDGFKFSTFQDGEYIVVRLDKQYISGEISI